MTAREHTTDAWKVAARDLGFQFVAGFRLQDGGEIVTYLGLLPEFGSAKGMLIITEADYDKHIHAAERNGFGYSCMSENFEPYDRETYIDVLNDWGWTGPGDRQPPWYTGESCTC